MVTQCDSGRVVAIWLRPGQSLTPLGMARSGTARSSKPLVDGKVSDLTGRIVEPEKKAALEYEVAKQLQFRGKRSAILANLRGDSVTSPAAAYEQVKEQGMPTLLIWGTGDTAVSEDSTRRLRALLPDIEYHQIEGASHLAHYEYSARSIPSWSSS